MKLPGVISLRNDLPTCAIPNGGLRRASWATFLKLTKIPCAVSGRRNTRWPVSSTGPTRVSNMRLNWRASVRSQSARLARALAGLAAALLVCEVVGAEALLAGAAVDERVGEAGDVARRLPDLRVEDDRGVERDDVVALLHHRLEPARLDVLLEEHAVVAVVVRRAEPAVDLRRREDEAAPAASETILSIVTLGHGAPTLPSRHRHGGEGDTGDRRGDAGGRRVRAARVRARPAGRVVRARGGREARARPGTGVQDARRGRRRHADRRGRARSGRSSTCARSASARAHGGRPRRERATGYVAGGISPLGQRRRCRPSSTRRRSRSRRST